MSANTNGGFFHFLKELAKTLLFALMIAFILRTFLFQPFHIPSASMEPNLYKGDYIITTKYSLGYGKYSAPPFELPVKHNRYLEKLPERGDVIVFKPEGSDVHYIKRLIGLPGDEVQMINGFLYLNRVMQSVEKISEDTHANPQGNIIRVEKYKESLEGSSKSHIFFDKQIGSQADNTPIFTVPEGHYFFMGDNRDHSADSRIPPRLGGIGMVPAANLVGRAEFVLLSVDEEFELVKPWTWGHLNRDRFFKGLR